MNKFGKGKSWAIFIVTIACMVALGLLAGFGFGEKKTGAAKNIILGLDLKGGVSITYEVVDEEGPAHNKKFTSIVKVDGIIMGRGTAGSKKASEQEAAKDALSKRAGIK